MHRFFGYLRTLQQYLATPKGQHDFWDDMRAGGLILLTILLVWLLINYLVHC